MAELSFRSSILWGVWYPQDGRPRALASSPLSAPSALFFPPSSASSSLFYSSVFVLCYSPSSCFSFSFIYNSSIVSYFRTYSSNSSPLLFLFFLPPSFPSCSFIPRFPLPRFLFRPRVHFSTSSSSINIFPFSQFHRSSPVFPFFFYFACMLSLVSPSTEEPERIFD